MSSASGSAASATSGASATSAKIPAVVLTREDLDGVFIYVILVRLRDARTSKPLAVRSNGRTRILLFTAAAGAALVGILAWSIRRRPLDRSEVGPSAPDNVT